MADELSIKVNGREQRVSASPDTPLLYVLTNELELKGPKFGCGLAQCGSCSVLADGVEIRSCVTPLANVVGKSVTTLEGLGAWYAEQRKAAKTARLESVMQEPMVRAVLDRFPGADVVAVRDIAAQDTLEPSEPEERE